jgi:UDPglucose 6-dehydrogenase
MAFARNGGINPKIIQAVHDVNDEAALHALTLAKDLVGNLEGKTISLLGLAFKPGTDDMREAPSRTLLADLIAAGAKVLAYDPVAMEIAQRELPKEWFTSGQLQLVTNQYEALQGVDAMLLVTEWKPFRNPDLAAMGRSMKQKLIFDGRNQYDPDYIRAEGFDYFGVGRLADG